MEVQQKMEMLSLEKELSENTYPGRGIVIGVSEDGKKAVTAYFIMGRSSNSRNRVFVTEGEGIRTEAFDPSKLEDPSLIIYAPVRVLGNKIMHIKNGVFDYSMSILKSNNGNPEANNRYTFSYENPVAGEGHFIHTYMHDGNPLPSFEGEPKWVKISGDIDEFTDKVWNSLNEDNKVSLFVRYIDIATGEYETKIVNKNK